MQIHADKFGHQSPEDVEHSPLLAVYVVEVELSNHLVNVVQQLDGEVLEGRVLPTLAVDLQEDMPLEELIGLEHIDETVELFLGGLFGDLTHADVAEVIIVVVRATGRYPWVGAVKHVVGHVLHR